jgi:regulator of sigma D
MLDYTLEEVLDYISEQLTEAYESSTYNWTDPEIESLNRQITRIYSQLDNSHEYDIAYRSPNWETEVAKLDKKYEILQNRLVELTEKRNKLMKEWEKSH